MSQELEFSLHPPVWPAIVYFVVSFAIFFLLYLGKLKVNRLHKYPLFIAYMVFVIAVAAVQINIFANGYEFVRSFCISILTPIDMTRYIGDHCFSP